MHYQLSTDRTMNDLGDLFNWVAKNVRGTSKEAFKDIKEDGTLSNQEQLIITTLKQGRDYSLQEISRLTGITINAVSGRCNGLKKKNWMVECEKRKCTITGKTIKPLALV